MESRIDKTGQNYWSNLNRLLRYIQRKQPGYAFACYKDFRLLKSINQQLSELLSEQQIRIKELQLETASETSFIRQLQDASQFADALIINNLSEYISVNRDKKKADTPPRLQEINFAREELLALRKPLIFWLSTQSASLLSNRATDLHSQRAINTVYFDEVSEVEFPVSEIETAFGQHLKNTEEYEGVKLKIRLLKKQLKDAKQNNYPKSQIAGNIALPLAKAYSEIDLHKEAIGLLLEYNDNISGKSTESLFTIATIYNNAGEYNKALTILKKSLSLIADNDFRKKADTLIMLSDVLRDIGSLKDALVQIKECHKILAERVDENPNDQDIKYQLGRVLSRQGDLNTEMGNLDKALEYYEDETILFEELYESYPQNVSFKNGLAISYEKLGETHSALGNLDKALEYYEERSRLGKELYESYPQNVSFKNGLAISYQNLGHTHSTLGNLDRALKYYEDFAKLQKELHDDFPQNVSFKNGLAISYIKLAVFYRDHKKDKKEALKYLKLSAVHYEQLIKIAPQYKEFHDNFDWVKNAIAALEK